MEGSYWHGPNDALKDLSASGRFRPRQDLAMADVVLDAVRATAQDTTAPVDELLARAEELAETASNAYSRSAATILARLLGGAVPSYLNLQGERRPDFSKALRYARRGFASVPERSQDSL